MIKDKLFKFNLNALYMKKRKLIISLISIICFFAVLIFVLNGSNYIDESIRKNIFNVWGSSLDEFFIFFGNYLKEILILIAVFFFIVLYTEGRKKESWIILFIPFMGYTIGESIKFIVKRVRPSPQLFSEIDYSFPSGHSVFSIILFSMIIYFYRYKIKNDLYRFMFIAINIVLILFSGFTRIYLNVHWFSDVIGGYLLGFFVFNIVLFIYESTEKKK